jgi:hypothetical protein
LRQTTYEGEEGERTRITYFCPTCQGTSVELKRPKKKSPQKGQSLEAKSLKKGRD